MAKETANEIRSLEQLREAIQTATDLVAVRDLIKNSQLIPQTKSDLTQGINYLNYGRCTLEQLLGPDAIDMDSIVQVVTERTAAEKQFKKQKPGLVTLNLLNQIFPGKFSQ